MDGRAANGQKMVRPAAEVFSITCPTASCFLALLKTSG